MSLQILKKICDQGFFLLLLFFLNSKWHLFQNFTYSLQEKSSKIESEVETLEDLSQISVITVCIFKYLFFSCFQKGKTRHQNISISHLNFTPSFSFLSHLLWEQPKLQGMSSERGFVAVTESPRKSSNCSLAGPWTGIYKNTQQLWKLFSN